MLAFLSALVAAPALLMIRLLERRFVLPAFGSRVIASHSRVGRTRSEPRATR